MEWLMIKTKKRNEETTETSMGTLRYSEDVRVQLEFKLNKLTN